MKTNLLVAAVLLAGVMPAAAYDVGTAVVFGNPYKTGCATPEIANKVRNKGAGMTEAEVRTCYKLVAGSSYRIAEVSRHDGTQFYRVPLSNGELVWTYIFDGDVASTDVKVYPQNRSIANAVLIMKMAAMVRNGEMNIEGPNKVTLSGREPTATVTRPNPDTEPCVYEIEDGRGGVTRVDFNRLSEEYRMSPFGFTILGANDAVIQGGQRRNDLQLIGRLDEQFVANLRFVWSDSKGKCSPAQRKPVTPKF